MIPRFLDAAAFVKELGDDHGGKTKPVVVIADAQDSPRYLLKTEHTAEGHWNAMFLQELLSAHIADFMGVPIPECAIINVDRDFIQMAPALQFQHRFRPGKHFASKFFNDAENNLKRDFENLIRTGKPYVKRSWSNFFEGISNPEDAAKIIVFDLFIGNFDRFGNFGNLLVARRNGLRTIFAIDHGHCFLSPTWCNEKIAYLQHRITPPAQYVNWFIQTLFNNRGMSYTMFGPMFRALDKFIHIPDPSSNPFAQSFNKLLTLNEGIIDQWFTTIPDEWFCAGRELQVNMYKQYLLRQRDVIPMIIDDLAINGAFDDHNGGVLEWNDSRTGTR